MSPAMLRDVFKEADNGSAVFDVCIEEMSISSASGMVEVLLDHTCSASGEDIEAASAAISEAYGIEGLLMRIAEGENRSPAELVMGKLK